MSKIYFTPRWREELVAESDEGILIFELMMGTLHVYFPDEQRWLTSVPDWAKEKWGIYHQACKDWCVSNHIPFSIVDNAIVYEEKKKC